MPHRPVR
ncbi:hypothetical protein YPPY32_4499, partial [Yersinia pestis PY-32]